jgi:predicted metal-dependent enzyme (double-stranded beta helix superfamily)
MKNPALLAELPSGFSSTIEAITEAVKSDRITALASALADLLAAGMLDDERLYRPPLPDHYARNLIWRDAHARFVVIGMSWAPGQGSPLHDHDALWGGEIVVSGTMHETRYQLLERDLTSRYRFAGAQSCLSSRGSVAMLTPPIEYHAFANAGDSVARTVHVYGGDLTKAQTFAHEAGQWYRAKQIHLRYDD